MFGYVVANLEDATGPEKEALPGRVLWAVPRAGAAPAGSVAAWRSRMTWRFWCSCSVRCTSRRKPARGALRGAPAESARLRAEPLHRLRGRRDGGAGLPQVPRRLERRAQGRGARGAGGACGGVPARARTHATPVCGHRAGAGRHRRAGAGGRTRARRSGALLRPVHGRAVRDRAGPVGGNRCGTWATIWAGSSI